MPELRLQSDLLRNMSLAQQRAMMQRGVVWENQQLGAFQGGYYSDVVPRGRANSYLRYYAQMQRDAMEHQRRLILQQQMMQRQFAVQQQAFMLRQQHEQNQIQRSEKERQDKLLEVRTRREKIQNDDRFSAAQKAHYDKQAALEEAELDNAPKLFTYTQEESGYFYPDNYPDKEKRGKPILNTIELDNQTGQKTITGVPAKEIYQDYQAKLKDDRAHDFEQEKERNSNAQKFAEAYFQHQQLKEKQEEERIKKLPFRRYREDDPNNRDSQWIGEDKAKELDTAATQEAIEAYISKRKADTNNTEWDNAVNDGVQPKIKALEEKYKAEAINELKNPDSDTSKERNQSDERMFNERFTFDQLGTGEMFAAQDLDIEQDMFDDPGMDFDPVDETYTLDEIA